MIRTHLSDPILSKACAKWKIKTTTTPACLNYIVLLITRQIPEEIPCADCHEDANPVQESASSEIYQLYFFNVQVTYPNMQHCHQELKIIKSVRSNRV